MLRKLQEACEAYARIAGDTWAEQAGGSVHASRKYHALAEAWRAYASYMETYAIRAPKGNEHEEIRIAMAQVRKYLQ